MQGIRYVNLIEIGSVVIEIRGVENSELVVPVNDTLVCHTAFLAADTRPCVLIVWQTSHEPPNSPKPSAILVCNNIDSKIHLIIDIHHCELVCVMIHTQ